MPANRFSWHALTGVYFRFARAAALDLGVQIPVKRADLPRGRAVHLPRTDALAASTPLN
jgi:hypothetical protein